MSRDDTQRNAREHGEKVEVHIARARDIIGNRDAASGKFVATGKIIGKSRTSKDAGRGAVTARHVNLGTEHPAVASSTSHVIVGDEVHDVLIVVETSVDEGPVSQTSFRANPDVMTYARDLLGFPSNQEMITTVLNEAISARITEDEQVQRQHRAFEALRKNGSLQMMVTEAEERRQSAKK